MRKFFKSAMLLTTFVFVQSAIGQEPTRIQFAKGKNSTVIRSETGSFGKTYILRAKSGQKIVLTLTPRTGVDIKVETNGIYGEQVLMREERGGTYEIGLEETGDYTIFLGSTSEKSASFVLTVKITKLSDI